ncbi:isochorismatase [Hortaea werneckii]|nr:isochorismatase [Hortaea werneckii]
MAVQSFREILGAPRSTASPNNSALVIIDAQNEYAEGKLKVSNAPETRKAIAALLKKYREGEGKIVHVVHDTPQGAPVFTPGSKLADEYDELKPMEGEKVIRKIHPSAFADTELHTYLRGIGGLKVVLTGYMAHVCVSTTARDAARLGYDILIAEDCVGDRDIPGASGSDVTKMVMHELADAFATVVQSSEIHEVQLWSSGIRWLAQNWLVQALQSPKIRWDGFLHPVKEQQGALVGMVDAVRTVVWQWADAFGI